MVTQSTQKWRPKGLQPSPLKSTWLPDWKWADANPIIKVYTSDQEIKLILTMIQNLTWKFESSVPCLGSPLHATGKKCDEVQYWCCYQF